MDNRTFDQIYARLERLENKVDLLLQFKWQIIGGSVVVSFFIAAVISIAVALLSRS